MVLPETFEAIRPSIIAIISKAVVNRSGQPPLFPPILGTGFIVDRRGLAVTNRHVVEVFDRLPRDPRTNRPAVGAMIFLPVETKGEYNAMGAVVANVVNWWIPTGFFSRGPWFGQDDPDIGLIQLGVTELPSVAVSGKAGMLKAGISVATAGFPLGETPITMFNKLTQVGPILRRGIISGVFPFAGALPHGFTTDIMIQGGASGSPVFAENDPVVLGMLGASLLDGGANTNISIGLPGQLIASAIELFLKTGELRVDGLPTLASRILHDGEPPSEVDWVELPIEQQGR